MSRINHDVQSGELHTRQLNEQGYEVLSPEPHERAQTSVRKETIAEQIRRMVMSERLAQAASAADMETFEEADDFDVGDDFDPHSPYEEVFDPPLPRPSPAPAEPVVKPAEGTGEAGEGLDATPTK